MPRLENAAELVALRKQLAEQRKNKRVFAVCSGTGCVAAKSGPCAEVIEQEIAKRGRKDVELRRTGCFGPCERGPIVVVEPEGTMYFDVKPKDCPEIVA